MSFSISGKLRCGVGVNFKPLLKIWICEGWIHNLKMNNTFVAPWPWRKKLFLTELLTFYSTWVFGTSYVSGTIMVCSFCSPGFRNATQTLKKEKKSKDSKKVKISTINKEITKAMKAVLAVEVTTNTTHINFQQTKPITKINNFFEEIFNEKLK